MVNGLPWGLALVSGVNTYLPLFILALFGRFSHAVHLSPRFQFLTSDQALILLGILAASEVLAQKFPGLDNVWDFLHTALRPIAGAIAAGAAVDTTQGGELVAAMLMGATLAAAAHSTKSGIRLVSTAKSFGVANLGLSLGEDFAVVSGSLLSVYWPWLMLGIVLVFAVFFVLVAPWLARTLAFDWKLSWGWLRWAGRKLLRVPEPASFHESLLEIESPRLRSLESLLTSGESLAGVLMGWRKSRGGPRLSYWLLTSSRILVVDWRLFREPKVEPVSYADVAVARSRNLGLFSKAELLTRQNQSFLLNVRRTHGGFGEMAVRQILDRREVAEQIDRLNIAGQDQSGIEKSGLDTDLGSVESNKKYTIN